MRKNCDVSSAFSASLVQQTNRLLSEWVFLSILTLINFNRIAVVQRSSGKVLKCFLRYAALRKRAMNIHEFFSHPWQEQFVFMNKHFLPRMVSHVFQ